MGFTNGKDREPDWAVELKNHYNHDTTKLLEDIRESQTGTCKKLDRVINLLEEQDKYGVKIRKN
ncbi:MAG: hypothetical protein DDT19_01680 [Syntrophomonadaceae bacterium]|nr:hypothetical protein [Bacillota bacterium]